MPITRYEDLPRTKSGNLKKNSNYNKIGYKKRDDEFDEWKERQDNSLRESSTNRIQRIGDGSYVDTNVKGGASAFSNEERRRAIELIRNNGKANAGDDRTTAINNNKNNNRISTMGLGTIFDPTKQGMNTAVNGADVDSNKFKTDVTTQKGYKGLIGTKSQEQTISKEDSLSHAKEVYAPFKDNQEVTDLFNQYVDTADRLEADRMSGNSGYSKYRSVRAKQKIEKQIRDITGMSADDFDKVAENYTYLRHDEQRLEQQEELDEASGLKKAALTVGNIPAAAIGNYYAMLGALKKPNDPELGRDYNSTEFLLRNLNRDTKEAVHEDIDESTMKDYQKALAGFSYDAFTMGAESAASQLLGGAGLASFFAGGYASSLEEAEQRGLTKGQAQGYALVSGGLEYATEKLPWDNLKAIYSGKAVSKDAVKGSLMPYVKALFKQAGEEASEEVINGMGDIIADALINSDKSKLNISINNYIASGLSEEEATRKALIDNGKDILYAAASAAVSAGASAGPALAIQAYDNTKVGRNIADYENKTGNLTRNAENANYISETRESYLADEDYNQAQETRQAILAASEKTAKGERISGREARALAESVDDTFRNLDQAKKVRAQQYIEKVKEQAENKAVEEIEKASTAVEVESIKEQFAGSEKVAEAVEQKKTQMVEEGKATEEDFAKAITPLKAEAMAKRGEEIAPEQLEKLPQKVQDAYEVGYSQRANDITKDASKLDVTQIKVSDNGKGKVEKIKSVSKNKDGVLVFETSSGKTVTAAEAEYSDKGKYFFEGDNGVLSLDEPALVQLAINTAASKPGISVGNLTQSIRNMYTLGATGVSFEEAIKSDGIFEKAIGRNALKEAYDEGAKKATSTSRAITAKKGKGFISEATEENKEAYDRQFTTEEAKRHYENEITDVEKKFLGALSNKIGVDLELSYDTKTNDRGRYEPSEGKVYLNLAVGQNLFEVALHEAIGEFMAASNESAYNAIVDSVLNAYAATNSNQLAKNIQAYQRAYADDMYGNTARGASRELFNDAIGEIFSSETNMKKMFDWMVKNEGVDQAEKVKKTLVDYLRDLVTLIKQIKANGGLSRLERQRLTLSEKQANDIADQILKAMDEAIANRDAGSVQQGESAARKSVAVLSNGTKYVIPENDIFIKEDGSEYSRVEAYKKILGKISTHDGQDVRILKELKNIKKGGKDKDLCEELFKRRPGRYNGVSDIKAMQRFINGHFPELLYNSDTSKIHEPSAKDHTMYKIMDFDERVVNFLYTDNRIYTLKISVGNLKNGTQVAYGKRTLDYNEELTKIMESPRAGESHQIATPFDSLSSSEKKATTKKGPKSINVEKLKDTARHSFAGIGSKTADMTQLNLASDMHDEGINEETILATTGWFLGMDNQWKYEIPDNDLIIFKDGNAKFLRDNKDFKRYNELMDKIFFQNFEYTEEEYDELVTLEDKVLKPTQNEGWLSDFVQHDKLFEAYPFLETTYVDFVEFDDDTTYGSADIYGNGIHLNKNFHTSVSGKWSENAMKSVLLHEIQHLIQRREDFANGASPEYWNEIKDMKIEDDKKAIEGAKVYLDRAIEGAKKNGKPTSIKEFVYDLFDKLDSGEITQDEYNKQMAQFKRSSVYHYENMINKLQRHVDRLSTDSNSLLYYNTAGEIEARDVSNRAKLTEKERREQFPKVDDKDVVYIDKGVSGRRFSKKVGDIEQSAIEHFGTTEDFKFAGYILTDGQMLDFSGAHWLEGASEAEKEQFRQDNGMRQVDHDDIYEVMEASGDNRKQFMDRGNIRLNPEAPGFNVSSKVEPTVEQYRQLKEFIREVKKNPDYDASRFYVDIEDTHPNKISYANNLNEDRIINDLKKYYETGEMPQQSSLNDFRYSIKVDWDKHNTYTIPARDYDVDNFFDLSDEEMDAAELQDLRVKAYIANIIHSKDFAGFMYSYKTESGHDKTRFLTRSTRDGYDYQFSYMDDGEPIMHSNIKDENDDITAYSNSQDMANFYSEVVHDMPMEGVDIHVVRKGVAEKARYSKVVFGEESPYNDALQQASVIENVLSTINNQLKGQSVSMAYLNKTVDTIIRKYKSNINAQDLQMELAQFIAYMTKSDQVDYNQMMNYLLNIGDEIIQSSQLKDPEQERVYNELKKELSSHKINLTENERKELISRYGGSWNAVFGKLNAAGIKLNNAGNHMDGSTYSEIADKFLEIAGVSLDQEVTAVDQIATIIDAMDVLAPSAYQWDGATDFDKAMDVAVTIIDSYYSMAASIKEANMAKGTEKGKKAIDKAVKTETAKLRAKNEEYKAKLNEEFQALVEDRMKVMKEQQDFLKRQAEIEKKFRGEKRAFDRRVNMSEKELQKTARLQAQMQYQGIKDTEAKRKHKDNIVRTSMRLINWMNKPTDARHVPSFMQPALTELIKSINFMPASMRKGDDGTISAIKWQESMRKLQQVIKSINSADLEAISDNDKAQLALVLNAEDIADKMESLLKKYGGTADISRMSKEDLKTLSDIMKSISEGISHMNENFMNRRFKHVSELAESSMDDMMQLKSIKDIRSVAGDKAANFLNLDMLEPISFFEELGESAATVMQEFFDGEKTGIEIIRVAENFFNKLSNDLGISQKDVRNWSNDAKTHSIDGGTITLTSADIMSLYCSYRREQLDQQERPFEATHHISAGGIKGFKDTYKKNAVQKYVTNRNARALHANEGKILELINSLSDKQIAYADAVVNFMSTTLAEYGNETSNKMNGYSKFNGKYYFPLKTDNNAIATTESNNQTGLAGMLALVHQSFTKSQLDKADNALVVMDFFDVVTEHITGMANYCAYSMPLSDALRWYNYATTERNNTEVENEYLRDTESVKGHMDRVKGVKARDYFENFLRSVNLDPASKGGSEIVQATAKALTGLARAKAIALNVSVWLQQPTAIVRASDVIEEKYLAQGIIKMKQNPKRAMEYAQNTNYLCYWKNKGFSDYRVQMGMKEIITGSETILQELQEKAGAPAGILDDTTWAAMYYAAEYKIKQTTNLDVLSEEYRAAVDELFSDIINHTQVIDSGLRTTQTMKGRSDFEYLANAFKKEPQKSYNMLHRAFYKQYQHPSTENKKALHKTIRVYVLTSIVNALFQTLPQAWRDDEDKEYWKKYLKKLLPYDSYKAVANAISDLQEGNEVKLLSFVRSFWGGLGTIGDNLDPLSSMPLVAEIDSWFKGWNPNTLNYTSFLSEASNTVKAFESRKATPYNYLYSLATLTDYFTGVGVSNALRDIRGIWNQTTRVTGLPRIEKSTANEAKAKKTSQLDALQDAFDKADAAALGSSERVAAMSDIKAAADAIYQYKYNMYLSDKEKPRTEAEADKLAKTQSKTAITTEFKPIYKKLVADGKLSEATNLKNNLLVAYKQLGDTDAEKDIEKWLKE